MAEDGGPRWLVVDGYEDEPAAFGVPPYIGFHVRYLCGVLEAHGLPYDYLTVDAWRALGRQGEDAQRAMLQGRAGLALLAGAVVPGKYLRATPISLPETKALLRMLPTEVPAVLGGWAIRGWRHQGWSPLRRGLFLALQDADATLHHFLGSGRWEHKRRTAEQWTSWAHAGATSKAVLDHPDLRHPDLEQAGPLTYEVEVYQGCVRYKRGCRFCIEPKKGTPVWRTPDDVIAEVRLALDAGVRHVRLGGMTDTYTYLADGVGEMEYPRPNPEPIARLLHGLREDERLGVLHTDNGNPSIIAEHLEEAEEITKTLVATLSDGAVLSFGVESADPAVHEANWLNCDPAQLKAAVNLINRYGRERGARGLPKLLPGLNFIAGLNGETDATYGLNMELLHGLRSEGHWLRRINLRQVEGEGFQDVDSDAFAGFKRRVRDEIDAPLLAEMMPIGGVLRDVHWEAHGGRTRLPAHDTPDHRDGSMWGGAGVSFGRQIGAYPILIGASYLTTLEASTDVMVTAHGQRSITGIELDMDPDLVTPAVLEAIPGVGAKAAWALVTERAKRARKQSGEAPLIDDVEAWFTAAGQRMPDTVDVHQILRPREA
ncbi:MAG: radical SAM protein [Candidatus Thermoplasmatota archaeon]|jgi:radical SAM superfamily enzyme with C-terminal helix-hairpin-helix motif|nr:radical SAM protein [Candidatus Thermoplasmatota archaeon]